MATIDDSLKVFFKEHKTTAALINWMVFGGRPVVRPSQIRDASVDESFFRFGRNGRFRSLSRQRDVCKVVSCVKDSQRSYMVVGIENQTTVDQFMAGRALAMNMMNYLWQHEVISDRNRSRPDAGGDSGEFLYGFRVGDRLAPVITLAIHWGRMKWTAPLSFRELVEDTEPSVRDFIPDFRLPLLVATDFAEKKQHTDEPNLDLLLHYVGSVFAGRRREFQWPFKCYWLLGRAGRQPVLPAHPGGHWPVHQRNHRGQTACPGQPRGDFQHEDRRGDLL